MRSDRATADRTQRIARAAPSSRKQDRLKFVTVWTTALQSRDPETGGFPTIVAKPKPAFVADYSFASTESDILPKPRSAFRPGIYAYSFWRWGETEGSLAAGGQYGGSQSGIIATWDLGEISSSFTNRGLALMMRISATPNTSRENELALGLRWKPLATTPVHLTAEQRIRQNAQDRFAFYAAGGLDDVALPHGFKFNVYGQAGVVSGRDGGPFFDASAAAYRKLLSAERYSIALGAGSWSGGQRGIARLDLGPSLQSAVKIGEMNARLSADWRFRVAGNAAPGNGPAVTLSTGF